MTSSARARIDLRDRQAERLGGLQVGHQLERRRLLYRQIGGLGALEDFADIDACLAIAVS
jgi:hypothetical protein